MRGYPYELVGGHVALDFLNSIHDRHAEEQVDRLGDFSDAIAFAAAAGVVRPAEARSLDDRHGDVELRQLRQLRERLARVLRALVDAVPPAASDLEQLSRDAAHAARVARLHDSGRGLARTIGVREAGAAVIRLRLADAAVALLSSELMADVKACPSCGWFFLDTSKNRSRRWCSMSMCGSVIKARRYYQRRTH